MENRDEMLEAIMVILETYDDEYIRHIFEVLTDTVHQEARVMKTIIQIASAILYIPMLILIYLTFPIWIWGWVICVIFKWAGREYKE